MVLCPLSSLQEYIVLPFLPREMAVAHPLMPLFVSSLSKVYGNFTFLVIQLMKSAVLK